MPRQPKLGKQKNGPYVYWGAIINGKRVRFGRVSEVPYSTANQQFLEYMLGARPAPKPPRRAGVTVEEMCVQHCQWHVQHNDKKSSDNRLSLLDRWCAHVFTGECVGGLQVSAVGRQHLASFVKQFDNGWTAWNYCVGVKAAFNWAHREGIIQSNPLAGYPNPPQPKADLTETTLMTPSEVAWFLEKSRPYHAYEILRVLYLTGARPGELCSAVGSDFIANSSQLRLLAWKNGKKSQMARRIPLPTEAEEIVARLAKNGSEPIFRKPRGSAWTPSSLHRVWRKIRNGTWRDARDGRFVAMDKEAAARLKKETAQRESLTIYSLRHLWISDALRQGVPIATAARIAGTSVKQIERTYGHFRIDDLNAIANSVAANR